MDDAYFASRDELDFEQNRNGLLRKQIYSLQMEDVLSSHAGKLPSECPRYLAERRCLFDRFKN